MLKTIINRRRRIKEGQDIIQHGLLVAEYREFLAIVYDEISSLLNTHNFDMESINVYYSSTGNEVRFFLISGMDPEPENCRIYDWGGWYMFRERIKFEWEAWNNGIRKINLIEVT